MTQAAILAASGSPGTTTGFKNRIINGAMVIDQRNAGASVTVNSSGAQYITDRWLAYADVASKYTAQQNAGAVTAPAGFTNYLGATSSSAYTVGTNERFGLIQFIEGYNMADWNWGTANAKTVTLSAWVYSSLTGTFGGSLQNYAGGYSYPFSYTINAANTWTQISVTIVGPTGGTWTTNNSGSLQLTFSLGAGSGRQGTPGSWQSANLISATGAVNVVSTSGATFYITGVQLEVGTTATNFDYRSYGTELALCQRYYQRSYDIGTATGASFDANYNIPAYFIGTGNFGFVCSKTFPTAMRGTPTITVYSATGTAGSVTPWNGSSSGTIAGVNANQNGITAGNFNNNTSGGVTYGFGYTAAAEL